MKPIEIEVRIDRPVAQVWTMFTDVELMPQWCKGFVSLETIEGEPETVGSKHRLLFQEGKRQIEMIETVTAFDPHERFAFEAATKGMSNTCEMRFSAEGDATVIRSTNCFYAGSFLFKLMMPMMRGAISKRITEDLERLKALVESRATA
ncbi:MAG: hypothetical protein CMJ94_05160 [Planctomycetes bacterium]|nr:hypothetical protein [Planctomycetota bacterium]